MGKLGWLDDAVKGAARNLDEAAQAAANQLDMSTAARMQRAAEQGFDTPVYHYSRHGSDIKEFVGTSQYDLSPFGIGPHVGTKKAASDRVLHKDLKGATYPLLAKTKRLFLDPDGNPWNEIELSSALRKMQVERFGEDFGNYQEARDWLANEMWGKYDAIPYINDVEDAGSVSYIENPSSLRGKFAAFDPKNIGKNDLLGAATIGGMATAGAVGAGAMAAQQYDFGTPDYDAKIQEFRNRRAAKSQIWKELKQAGATIASAIPAGIVSDAYRIGGYLSPVTSLDETEQGAEVIQNALMYTPDGENRYLNEFARQIQQFEKDVQPMVNAWKQTPIYKGYKQLPERVQRLVKTASDYAF